MTSLMNEGTVDDRVTNFARLLQSMDEDFDSQNGIQLHPEIVADLNPNLDFADNASLVVQNVELQELPVFLQRGLCVIWPKQPETQKTSVNSSPSLPFPAATMTTPPSSGLIGVVFDENLRTSTIQPNSLQLLDSNGSKIVAMSSLRETGCS